MLVDLVVKVKEKHGSKVKDLFMEVLKNCFGPNSFTHFSPKKNQDLMLPLASVLSSDDITAYIDQWLCSNYFEPNLDHFYHSEDSTPQKVDSIKQFCLG